jgi:hypothetical protein
MPEVDGDEPGELNNHLHGLLAGTNKHVAWLVAAQLAVGDEPLQLVARGTGECLVCGETVNEGGDLGGAER